MDKPEVNVENTVLREIGAFLTLWKREGYRIVRG